MALDDLTPEERYEEGKRNRREILNVTQAHLATLQAGDQPLRRVLNWLNLIIPRADLIETLVADVEIQEYAKVRRNNPAYDLQAQVAPFIEAIRTAGTDIAVHPAVSNPAFILNADNTSYERQYTPTQTASIQALMQAVLDA